MCQFHHNIDCRPTLQDAEFVDKDEFHHNIDCRPTLQDAEFVDKDDSCQSTQTAVHVEHTQTHKTEIILLT